MSIKMVQNGNDQIEKYRQLFTGKRLGILTSATGRNHELVSVIDLFCDQFYVTAFFSPEHGIRGDKGPGESIDNYIDPVRKLPVYSLYSKKTRHFSKEGMDLVDAVVYDILDLGTRYYTFISTMITALYDCKKYNKELIILDRINPLSGMVTEGCVLNDEYKSLVGAYSIPVRYGLTVGELALMVNEEQKIGCHLSIVPIKNWKRSQLFIETEKIWILPSPNIPRFETALLYPGMCLLEGTNLSEGRGTACPFEVVGAPFIDGELLTKELMSKKLQGVVFTPAYFTPSSSKYADKLCQGVHIHITDIHGYESYKAGLTVLETIKDRYADQFIILPKAENSTHPMISFLHGNNFLENKEWTVNCLMEKANKETAEFEMRKIKYHLYR